VLGKLRQRRLRVALGKGVVRLGQHFEQTGGGTGMIVDHEHAARPARHGLGKGAVVRDAHILAGRGPHDHFVVEHLQPRQVFDAGDERDVVDGLGQKVIGAALEPLDLVGRLVERRHHDDRDMMGLGRRLDAAAGLEPVHARHHHVEKHDIDPFARQNIERFLAAVGRQHFEILRLKPRFEQLHVGQDVIDDENSGGHIYCLALRTKRQTLARPAKRWTVSRKVITEIGFEM